MDKIKVAIRTRPLNKRENELGSTEIVTIHENQVILNDSASNKDGRNTIKSFAFDACFDSSSEKKENFADQKKVFSELGFELVENVLSGYNTCVFAYGQTGSGKSFTMMGGQGDDQKGLIPRLCENLFENIGLKSSDDHLFKIEVSYMEIYNEKVRDLLDPSGSKQNLKLREHRLLGVYVDGLSQLAVSSYKEIEVLMNKGNKSRTVAATNMNAESSRSHAVFCVQVSQNIIDKQSELTGEKLSRLALVDLAGSEKVSKTGAEGFRLKEGCNINKSLSTLGLVISILAENASNKNKAKHVPYRDSVLTWLLKDSLGGNSKTVMISTISTSSDNYDETLSTLRYADRAKRIVNNAVVNEDPNAKLIRSLRDELENLKKELEKAKEQIGNENLNDRFKESEKLYNEISKPWTEKLAESQKVQDELTQTLQSMGISVQSSGIKVEKDKYFLVNINSDPSMNELLVYYLKETTLVGRPSSEIKQDIQLIGPGIAPEHCIFNIKNNCVYITPVNNAKTRINGLSIKKETLLQHGDRIEIGINHFFRLNSPSLNTNDIHLTRSEYDLSSAQEEILFSKLKQLDDSEAFLQEADSAMNSNQSAMSTSSSSSSIGQPIYKIIQNSTLLDSRIDSDETNTQIMHGFKKLRDQLIVSHSLAREANSICKELSVCLRFSVTLYTPPRNLTPTHKKDTFLFEPAICARSLKNNTQRVVVDVEKFEFFIIHLRDIYFIFQSNPKLIEDNEKKISIIDPIVDLILDARSNNTLIGVANVYLDSLFVESCILFEYDVPIISEVGELNGRLKIKMQRIDNASLEDDLTLNENVNTNRVMKFKFNIVEAFGMPRASNNSIFCQYQFWIYKVPFIARQQASDGLSTVKFDYENEFSIEMTEEFVEYCLDGCLSIEIFGQNILPLEETLPIENISLTDKQQAKRIENFNQIAKYENLIQSWSELSKSFEIHIHILELNSEGNWIPVEVKQNELNKTGGVYQLKQGQSRQISVRIKPTEPKSKMWYNGALFNLEAHKIDRVSAGCVLARDVGTSQPLDSYQEVGLNNLKDKCRKILETRKQYLYEQLKELETLETEEDKERYEILCKQLVDLGEDQASIDAPSDNSNLPGSVIDWEPYPNMEEHVPIIYLDLNQSLNTSLSDYDDDEDAEDSSDLDDLERIESKKSLNSITCGKDCFLKHEQSSTKFHDLKIIRWNNSEMLEISADGDIQENDLFDDSAFQTIKALSLWDSSIHQSAYLNQVTPFDKNVYFTLKINLKMKLLTAGSKKTIKYVDLVLRKRIAVSVYSANSLASSSKFTLNRFKTLLVSSRPANKPSVKSIVSSKHSTSLIYRMIADIPKTLTEIENHESFVIKAAASLIEEKDGSSKADSNETSILFFDQYLRTIRAVDSILRRDRIQQQEIIKKISKLFYKKNQIAKSFTNSPPVSNVKQIDNSTDQDNYSSKIRKNLSVPNLINNVSKVLPINALEQKNTASDSDKQASEVKNNFMEKKIIDSAQVNDLSFKDLLSENASANNLSNLHNNTKTKEEHLLSFKQQSENNETSNKCIKDNGELKKKSEDLKSEDLAKNFKIQEQSRQSDFIIENQEKIIIEQKLKEKLFTVGNLDPDKSRSNSNNSIASTLTNSSQLTSITSQDRLNQQSQATEIIPDWVIENSRVIVSTNSVMNKRGFVRYIGATKFAQGIWIGVELEEPHGKNDGALKGVRYFKCPENRGVFVKADKLTLVNENI